MSDVAIGTQDRVLRIEMARPEKKNALTGAMYDAMSDALDAAARDPGVRVALIHGARDCFTSGNDLKDFLERPPHSEASPAFRFIQRIATFPKPLVAGYQRAAELLLLGRPFGVEKAFAAGLVTEVIPADELLEYAWDAALGVAALPPAAVQQSKALLKKRFAPWLAEAMSEEGALFRERLASPEAKEAMTAFFEKRKPDFSRF